MLVAFFLGRTVVDTVAWLRGQPVLLRGLEQLVFLSGLAGWNDLLSDCDAGSYKQGEGN